MFFFTWRHTCIPCCTHFSVNQSQLSFPSPHPCQFTKRKKGKKNGRVKAPHTHDISFSIQREAHFPSSYPPPSPLPNQQRTLNKLPTELHTQKFLSLSTDWACKSVRSVQKKVCAMCTCSDWASILHATVGGWVLEPMHTESEKQTWNNWTKANIKQL